MKTKEKKKKKLKEKPKPKVKGNEPSKALKKLKREVELERKREAEKHAKAATDDSTEQTDETPYPERVRQRLIEVLNKGERVSMYDVACIHQTAVMDEKPYSGEE